MPSNRLGDQLAEALRQQLTVKGMLQADLAREMGVTQKHVHQIMVGKATGSPGLLDYAAFVLGCRWEVRLIKEGE